MHGNPSCRTQGLFSSLSGYLLQVYVTAEFIDVLDIKAVWILFYQICRVCVPVMQSVPGIEKVPSDENRLVGV